MILIIDNYDSFVYNLARYISELGHARRVARNDAIALDDIASLAPSHIILSPGPCTPSEAGICNNVIERFGPTIPILGVCLGHQCIGQVYGGQIVRAKKPVHGKTSPITHDGNGVFQDMPPEFKATRYHSLIVSDSGLPDDLEISAYSPDGEIMGLRHRKHPVAGVQFHPEAVLTEGGYTLLKNFIQL
ncbi:MAG: aminodeoxychorismate/anthranilate synthase component II [Anaerolineae bacterium]|nr:aminodeoxychorismate/anthranilate synthase component II [Anaerolineae bacterium]